MFVIKRYIISERKGELEIGSYFVYSIMRKKKKVSVYNEHEMFHYDIETYEGEREYEWFSDLEAAELYYQKVNKKEASFDEPGFHTWLNFKTLVFCSLTLDIRFKKPAIDEYEMPEDLLNVLKKSVIKFIHPRIDDLSNWAYCSS